MALLRPFLCAEGHHFVSSGSCPAPGCQAEVRRTSVDPRDPLATAPAFALLPR